MSSGKNGAELHSSFNKLSGGLQLEGVGSTLSVDPERKMEIAVGDGVMEHCSIPWSNL